GLTWDTIANGNSSADNVTQNLYLPQSLTVNSKTIGVSWAVNDPTYALTASSWDPYSYVDRPAAEDSPAILTATLSYDGEDADDEAATATRVFNVTVKAEGVTTSQTVLSYSDLMGGIAATYASSDDPWVVMDMEAYNNTDVAGTLTSTGVPSCALAMAAQGNDPSAILTALGSSDLTSTYAIYTIPYVLLAYDAWPACETTGFSNTRDSLVEAMVAYLNGVETNYADTDEITPILAALAKYYNAASYSDALGITEDNYNAVKAAVTAGITWLSEEQSSSGTWSYYGVSNANSTALAVVALSALGIDAHTDSRFIKNYNSAIEGLMSFGLSDYTGFGYKGNVTKNSLATEQGFRALVSYARFKANAAAYNIYTDAGTSTGTVAAPSISVINPPASSGPSSSGTITVYFTLIGDTVHGEGAHTAYETWITRRSVRMEGSATVGDVFATVLDANGYTYEGLGSGYISGITTPDDLTLSAFDNGPYSGWVYTVNGERPNVGLNDCTLSNGDDIVWQYADDYRTTTESADQEETATGSTEPETEAPPFTDTDGHWGRNAIVYAYDKGLMNGVGDGLFDPDGALSRAMLAAILYRLEGEPSVSAANLFSDMEEGQWYTDAILWAGENGIVDGYGGGLFGPGDIITREQFATILYRYAVYKGLAAVTLEENLTGYADADEISDYAIQAMNWAVGQGFLTGRTESTLAPGGTVTRAEAATILMRFLESMTE
ncbi:MAG: S-layer homology domain-containing protein, partial [Bacillota bacterium]|nr:S-layer homology domain-containing protein [Bacillota bacterium]